MPSQNNQVDNEANGIIMSKLDVGALLRVDNKLELCFNSTGILVGSFLFCLQHIPCSVGLRCMPWHLP